MGSSYKAQETSINASKAIKSAPATFRSHSNVDYRIRSGQGWCKNKGVASQYNISIKITYSYTKWIIIAPSEFQRLKSNQYYWTHDGQDSQSAHTTKQYNVYMGLLLYMFDRLILIKLIIMFNSVSILTVTTKGKTLNVSCKYSALKHVSPVLPHSL